MILIHTLHSYTQLSLYIHIYIYIYIYIFIYLFISILILIERFLYFTFPLESKSRKFCDLTLTNRSCKLTFLTYSLMMTI